MLLCVHVTLAVQGVQMTAFSPLGHSGPELFENPVIKEVAEQVGKTPAQVSCPAPALPCPALPCLPCPALPCPALPCPALLRTAYTRALLFMIVAV